MRRAAGLIGVVLLAITAIRPAAAQDDARLRGAVALAQEGKRDSAMTAVNAVRYAAPAGSALAAEALYTAGILATNADTMRRILQQVVVEQSLSPWADDALLRLAQLDYAGGNLPAATRDLERLRSDFPNSDVFAEAAFWAARTYFDARQDRPACEWVGLGLARAADNQTELLERFAAFARRCPGLDARRETRDTSPAVETAQPTVDSQRSTVDSQQSTADSQASAADTASLTVDRRPSTAFRVQVIAAGTRAIANETVSSLRRLGFDAVIVEEGGLLKVRAGSFASRAEAAAAQRKLAGDFPGAFVVSDQ
jgi:cell division septation protein DedD